MAFAIGNGYYGNIFVAPWPTTDWWASYAPSSNVRVIPVVGGAWVQH